MFQALFPDRPKSQDSLYKGFSVFEWAVFLDMTAALQKYGLDNYSTFISFTPRDIEQHITLYMMNVLSDSYQIEMQFSLQAQDPVNGKQHRTFFVWL